VGSSRVYADCRSYREWKNKAAYKPPLCLVLQTWIEFPPELEFRCFVYEKHLNAINQLCWELYVPTLDLNKEYQDKIITSIIRLHEDIKAYLPYNNYILDIIYNTERDCAQICEFNPWGPYSCTGSQLFNWELDEPVLFGKLRRNDRKPILRLLRPGMKIEDHFDLYLSHDLYNYLSEEMLDKISKMSQRCVCCTRKSRPNLPPKPETKLCHITIPIKLQKMDP